MYYLLYVNEICKVKYTAQCTYLIYKYYISIYIVLVYIYKQKTAFRGLKFFINVHFIAKKSNSKKWFAATILYKA